MKYYVWCGPHKRIVDSTNLRFAALDAIDQIMNDESIRRKHGPTPMLGHHVYLNERGWDSPPDTMFDAIELSNEMNNEIGEE